MTSPASDGLATKQDLADLRRNLTADLLDEMSKRFAEQDIAWDQRLRDTEDRLTQRMDAGFAGIHDRLDAWMPRETPHLRGVSQ